ncbi:hypothetical protein EDD86DRAFT_198907 [Gorgonomyces haynaldii]|nr:hypothetical protein EDD86DRAFT_198907 [Gorgonomyces haynaldii]
MKRKSCDCCYTRKVKCDMASPACTACVKSSRDCVYTDMQIPFKGRLKKKSNKKIKLEETQVETPESSETVVVETPQMILARSAEDLRKECERLYIDDVDVKQLVLERFSTLVSESSAKPYLPLENLKMLGTSNSLLFAMLSTGCVHSAPDIMPESRAKILATNYLDLCLKEISDRSEDLSEADVLAITIASSTVLHLRPNMVFMCRELLFQSVKAMDISELTIPALSEEAHFLKCLRINLLWTILSTDVHFASTLNDIPPLMDFGLIIPLPVPRIAFYDRSYTFSTIEVEQGVIKTPPMCSMNSCYVILLVIYAKVLKFRKEKFDSTEDMSSEQDSIERSLDDWRCKFAIQIPNDSTVVSLVWLAFIEIQCWGIYHLLHLPNLAYYLKNMHEPCNQNAIRQCVQAACTIANLMRVCIFSYGINFERIPQSIELCFGYAGITSAKLMMHHQNPLVKAQARQNLSFFLDILEKCSCSRAAHQMLLNVVLSELDEFGLGREMFYQRQEVTPPIVIHRLTFI